MEGVTVCVGTDATCAGVAGGVVDDVGSDCDDGNDC